MFYYRSASHISYYDENIILTKQIGCSQTR